jgi:flagellar basal-body rod modification protein FlgD
MTAPVLPPTGAPPASSQVANAKSSSLDKDGFLKLFVAQLQNQDPSSPMSTTDSMNQMASFSMVEQLTNMAGENTKIATNLTQSSAVALLGKTVTYLDTAGASHTGPVQAVNQFTDGSASLTVDGTTGVDPTSITTVA